MIPVTLDLTLRQGEFALEMRQHLEIGVMALVGPSGAGKTTVLDCIAGLRRPDRGEIRIGEHTLFSSTRGVDVAVRRRRVGYVPQDVALFPHLNVRRNIVYGAHGGRAPALDRVAGILEIAPFLERRVQELSGGERQRVAVARALMSAPDLLLLDEPLASVDIPLRRRIVPYLRRVRDELAVPMLYVSHDHDEVRALADWVVRLDAGRVTGCERASNAQA